MASRLIVSALVVNCFADPYSPTWIEDPEALIDCNAEGYHCHLEEAPGACRDYPYRFCVPTWSPEKQMCKEAGVCYNGCEEDKRSGQLPDAACMHKGLFPMLPQDLLLFLVLFLIAIAAGAAGIGGGGLNLPMNMIIASFDIKEARPLSHSAVLGNAIAQLVMNCPQQHPKCKARPLIHYELAFLLVPALLGGSSLGLVVGRVMPGTLIGILAVAMLLLAASKTVIKGRSVLKECRALKEAKKSAPATAPAPPPSSPPANGDALTEPLKEQADERMRIPWCVIACMITFNLFVLVDVLLQAKDVTGCVRCSPLYWVLLIGLYPFIFAALYFGISGLKKLAEFHEERGDGKIEGDPEVSVQTAVWYAGLTAIVGLLAGILGLGGGEFMVPLLLEFGLLPRVASATSGFMIVFSTSNNIIHYLITGTLSPILGYAVGCMIVANIGAFAGLILRDTQYMRENSYFVVFTLAALLFISMMLTIYQELIVEEINFAFGSFC